MNDYFIRLIPQVFLCNAKYDYDHNYEIGKITAIEKK